MFSREIADRLKIKLNCKSDRALAERMDIKYGTFANWMARDAMQFDIVIQFLVKEGMDLNEILAGNKYSSNSDHFVGSIIPRVPKSKIEEMVEEDAKKVINDIREGFVYIAKNGNLLMLEKFSDSITGLIAMYKSKADEIQEFMKK